MPVASLGVPAREAALAAMLDGVFEGASISERMLTLFDASWNPNALGSLSLWVSTKDVETGSMWLDGPTGADQGVVKLEPVPGIRLEFGPARGEGIAFTLPQG